ncbi:MAG: hypothetical protein ACLR8U_14970 [Oscillospiraceae bacterium]
MNFAMQRYEAWRRQPGLDEMLANELLAMEGDAEKLRTASAAILPSARRDCVVCSARARTA